MNVQGVYDQFRSEMFDRTAPYFWLDSDVFRYMDDAYRMFVRLTGGIPDFTSKATQVEIVSGEAIGCLHPSILRIMSAKRESDGATIRIINPTDLPEVRASDYGMAGLTNTSDLPGAVVAMVVGAERNKCQWVQVPVVDDVAKLHIYRLPLVSIPTESPDTDFEFDGVGEEHHSHFVLWMRRLAYLKDDPDGYDPDKSNVYEARFRAYCSEVRAEVERYKHKTRVVSYGGI